MIGDPKDLRDCILGRPSQDTEDAISSALRCIKIIRRDAAALPFDLQAQSSARDTLRRFTVIEGGKK